MLRLQEGNTEIEMPPRPEHAMDLPDHLDRIGYVFEDRIADHTIEFPVGDRYVVYRRVDVYVSIMQTVRDVLVDELSVDQRGEVAQSRARIQHLPLEIGLVLTDLVLEAGPDRDRRPRELFESGKHNDLFGMGYGHGRVGSRPWTGSRRGIMGVRPSRRRFDWGPSAAASRNRHGGPVWFRDRLVRSSSGPSLSACLASRL